MWLISVTLEVSKVERLSEEIFEGPSNIPYMVVTLLVLNSERSMPVM